MEKAARKHATCPAHKLRGEPTQGTRHSGEVRRGGACGGRTRRRSGNGSVREALAADLPKKEYNITFVNHVTTNPFFTPTVYGIEDACAFFGCSHQWTGSQTSTVTEMVAAMQTAIANKVDGIAVCLVDAEAFNQPTEDALSIGIPVIGYNADTTPNARLAYVGQSLYQSGYNIAQGGCRWWNRAVK